MEGAKMNSKLLIVFLSAILLVGCATPRIVYKDVAYPVYVVPAPPPVNRPVLIVDTLTPAESEDPGIVLRAQRATSEQKNGYITELELIINKYRELATASAANLARLLGPTVAELPPQTLDSASTDEWKKRMAPVPPPIENK
jgi:hypothetical protein